MKKYRLREFLPLIVVLLTIAGFVIWQNWGVFDMQKIMLDSMAGFFLVFGLFKVLKLKGFVEAYRMYDIVAQRSKVYAYLYPFLELGLGVFYLTRGHMRSVYIVITVFTIVLMSISIIGVTKELLKGRKIPCACLGTVFKIPMTWVTFLEDAAMITMAAWLLIHFA